MRYAYNAVLKFPTCILPVGLGANLVRILLMILVFSCYFFHFCTILKMPYGLSAHFVLPQSMHHYIPKSFKMSIGFP